jgi:hypothetical protein
VTSAAIAPRKLVLAYVDSLRTDMLERAIAAGRAPNFQRLKERGVFIGDCVSSFPSVTPVACAEMVTGHGADRHWISGMNWYHRLERRYVEYGSSLEASRAFGVFRSLYDLVYNMNLAHLNPELETIFETLDDAGQRTACTPFLIYRGRHRHAVTLEGLVRRAIDVTGLKLSHHTWGPRELFYGDLYNSRPFPCKASSIPGNRDDYSSCCAAELAAAGLFDFLLLSLPDNDHFSHRHGPEASVESIARADNCFGRLIAAAGGLDGFLADHALILVADHAHTDVDRELPLIEGLADTWTVLGASQEDLGQAELAVCPSGRAAHVYRLADHDVPAKRLRDGLFELEGVDLCCSLVDEEDRLLDRRAGTGFKPDPGLWARIESRRGSLEFRPAGDIEAGRDRCRDRRGNSWQLRGELEAIGAEVCEGVIDSAEYPDPLARTWSALLNPQAGDVIVSAAAGFECRDWGGASHVGGGSHGSLAAGDSLGPLLFVGCGPESAAERDQWSLRDVVPVIRDFFEVPV